MITIKPDFYNNFKCIASKCTDTCCVGWEIDIDEESYGRYMNYGGEYGEILRANIDSKGEFSFFKLKSGGRCPFLNENNLCNMIINCGEDILCEICREHPRFYEWYENYTDMGLGLCCEETCRLLLEDENPLSFIFEEVGMEEPSENHLFLKSVMETRNIAFSLLQDRSVPFSSRIINLMSFTKTVQNKFFIEIEEKFEGIFYKRETTLQILQIFSHCEPYNEEYPILIKNLRENIDVILKNEADFDKCMGKNSYCYEKLLTYLLFRYYMKALYDGNLISKINFCLVNLWIIKICDIKTWLENKSYNFDHRINIIKAWSKQTEYSDENVDFLIRQCGKNKFLSQNALKSLFLTTGGRDYES